MVLNSTPTIYDRLTVKFERDWMSFEQISRIRILKKDLPKIS